MAASKQSKENTAEYDLLTISLAGHIIAVRSSCAINRKAFKHYTVNVAEADVEHTVTLDKESVIEHLHSNDDKTVYFFLHKDISDWLVTKNVLTIHASALICEGKAYLFSAPSGTGKSTHTRIWRRVFGDQISMTSDDQPLVRIDERGIYACGSLWNGKERLGRNIEAPVGGICIIRRCETNRISTLSHTDALAMLSPNVYIPSDPELACSSLKLLCKLALSVPIYSLECNMTNEAAVFAKNSIVIED